MIRNTLGTNLIQARPYVIYQWLLVLRQVNPLYTDDPALPSFATVKRIIDKTNEAVIEQAQQISDPQTILFEASLGDDVSRVRTLSHTS